ncbi:TPA: shikimate kinase [Candidatus Poribacteria bacterium]|jgi:shikimate kinase|nr:shikimate kinase [Candidatus Poribacteria bacterium]
MLKRFTISGRMCILFEIEKAMSNIVLIGFMGTGKTTVGQQISKELWMPMVDTDTMVEVDNQMIIGEIFDRYGEGYFRNLETAAVRKVSKFKSHVISTGGGVVLRFENLNLLQENGLLFCLRATPEEIFERIKDESRRPLLKDPDPPNKIRQLLQARQAHYQHIEHQIETTNLSIEEVTNQIIGIYQSARSSP